MTDRLYSSISQETTLAVSLNSTSTSMIVNSASALLAGKTPANSSPLQTFTIVIDPDTALEEIVDVVYPSTFSNNTLTIQRNVDGSTPVAHSIGAKVRHMAIGRDFTESNQHAANLSTAHNIDIANVVYKNTAQTLTNKTLTAPSISGGSITGISTPSTSTDVANKAYVDTALSAASLAFSLASTFVASTMNRYRYLATLNQTSVSGADATGVTLAYTLGKEQVFLNGVLLVRDLDYTASTGTSITALAPMATNDILEVVTFSPLNVTNTINTEIIDNKGELIVGTADNTVGKLAVGVNTQAIVADSTTATGLKWADVPDMNLTIMGIY